jgi:hypothetical protein
MKKQMLEALQVLIDEFLADCDESFPDHEYVHPDLANQMAAAAAAVYDSGQAAQKYERTQRSE